MKIAILAPEFIPTWGGVGIYTVELARALSKIKSVEIHIITPKRGENYNKSEILKQFNNQIFIHNVSTANDTFFYNFKFQLSLLKEFPRLHEKYQFDLIHATNLVHMPDILLKLFNKIKIPMVCTIHATIKSQVTGTLNSNKKFLNMAPSEKMSLLLYPIISLLEKIYINKTDNFITVSNKYSLIFTRKFNKNVIAVPNGINLEIFNYDKIKNPYKNFPMLKNKKKIVLFTGRLIASKGIKLILRLIKDIDAHFVIAGSGDQKILLKQIKEHNIPKSKFTFLGYVPNSKLPSLYKLSTIFILPSFTENFPISLLEANAMKCPCISTKVGAVDEIIENNRNGFLIEPGDYDSLKEKTHLLLNNKKLRKKFAKNGHNKVIKNFTSKQMAKKTYKIYKELIEK